MTTIYVLTTGDYSDYKIVGVFSTEEKATAAIEFYGKNAGDCTVETYELDGTLDSPNAPPPGMNTWLVFINPRMTRALRASGDTELKAWFNAGQPTIHSCFSCYCHATDEQHAVKIASEKRAKMLAESPPPAAEGKARVPYDSHGSIINF